MLNITQVHNNIMYGLVYGYSECCIKYFHQRQFDRSMFKDHDHKFKGTGYIPCKICRNQKYHNIASEIDRRRICDTHFPIDAEINGIVPKEFFVKAKRIQEELQEQFPDDIIAD